MAKRQTQAGEWIEKTGTLDQAIAAVNTELGLRKGFEPICITYRDHKGAATIAFIARNKSDGHVWQFSKSDKWSTLQHKSNKAAAVFYVNDVKWFVGVK